MDNKQKQAIQKLLERKGYIIYDIDIFSDFIVIEGLEDSVDYGYEYNFKVDIPNPIVREEGKSMIDMIVERIEDYKKDLESYIEEFSKKKEFESKQYANKILTEMFEKGIKSKTDVCVYSDVVGRAKGKTSTVAYVAQKHNLPIVVSNNIYKNLFKKIDRDLEVHTMSPLVAGLDSKIVLVDELETKYMERLTDWGYIVIGIVK